MEKILIYIGLNKGEGLERLLGQESFTKVIGFEPIPELFENLKLKYQNNEKIEILPYVVDTEDQIKTFFVTQQNSNSSITYSSSLYEITEDYRKYKNTDISTRLKIEVKSISLLNFLKERNIDFIDTYISDAEGNDFKILSSIKEFTDNKKIKIIQVESEPDYVDWPVRANQPHNKERDFVNLLSSNYDLIDKQNGNYDINSPDKWVNRDITFKLK
jgi:FkbM family methyltransferase